MELTGNCALRPLKLEGHSHDEQGRTVQVAGGWESGWPIVHV
jgi:hypothetical protein